MVLFGPQLILHTLGQVLRQSLEFVTSGASPEDAKGVNIAFRTWAGPREDRPYETFPGILNLKTVVWVVGFLSLALHVIALSSLDMLNVFLLLPSLLFSVSALVGPFVMTPKAGNSLRAWVGIPKVLGWLSGVAVYLVVSWMVAQGGWIKWLGIILLAALFAFLLGTALRYFGYHRKLNKIKRTLVQLLSSAEHAEEGSREGDFTTHDENVEAPSPVLPLLGERAGVRASHPREAAPLAEAAALAQQIIQQASIAPEQLASLLEKKSVPVSFRETILKHAHDQLVPLLRSPVADLRNGRFAENRFVAEFNGAFLLSLFMLALFYIVPVPGLFVFTASDYRLSFSLGTFFRIVGWIIALALASLWIGQFIEWIRRAGIREQGLKPRIEKAYQRFQALLREPAKLSDQEVSGLYALFTDVQTYLDQRGYAYAARTLGEVEKILRLSDHP
jgi:hypothetical protein